MQIRALSVYSAVLLFGPAATAQPTGACCLGDGSCSVRTAASCWDAGGAYAGDGVPCAVAACSPLGPVLYVNAAAVPGGDGTSWSRAMTRLEDAIQRAYLNPARVSQIWVASGVYKPDGGTRDRSMLFYVRRTMALYGGFAGFETDPAQRNIAAHPTVLSGDLAGNDGANFANNAENSFNVIQINALNVVFDGFTVRGGNGSAPQNINDSFGAGLKMSSNGGRVSNCRFESNFARLHGGGASLDGPMTMQSCVFVNNATSTNGAALAAMRNEVVTDCSFSGSVGGPAVYLTESSRSTFTNCVWSANPLGCVLFNSQTSSLGFTGIDCLFEDNLNPLGSPGIAATANGQRITLTRCTLRRNTGSRATVRAAGAPLIATDCLFQDNFATRGPGGAASLEGAGSIITRCTFSGNSVSTTGFVPFGGALQVGVDTSGAGCAVLDSCILESNAAARGGGIYVDSNGCLSLVGNSTINGNTAPLGAGIYNAGVLVGSPVLDGSNALHNVGTLDPAGLSIGSMVLGGGFSMDRATVPGESGAIPATFRLDVGGPGMTQDTVSAPAGAVLSGGKVVLRAAPGYVPLLGHEFSLLSGAPVTGRFDVVQLGGMSPGQSVLTTYSPTGATSAVRQLGQWHALTGDALLPMSATPVDFTTGDINHDGFPDLIVIFAGTDPSQPGSVRLYQNLGVDENDVWRGFSTNSVSEATPPDPIQVISARLNGDDADDIAVVCSRSDTVAVYRAQRESVFGISTPALYAFQRVNVQASSGPNVFLVLSNLNAGDVRGGPGTTTNAPLGVPAGSAFVIKPGPNRRSNGRYFEISLSTEGFRDLSVSMAWRGAIGGFTDVDVSCRVAANPYVDISTNLSPPPSFGRLQFSLPAAASNVGSTVLIRFTLNGATDEFADLTIDNIVINGVRTSSGAPAVRDTFLFNTPLSGFPSLVAPGTDRGSHAVNLAVAVANTSAPMAVWPLLNDGVGGFRYGAPTGTGDRIRSLAMVDMAGDETDELVYVRQSGATNTAASVFVTFFDPALGQYVEDGGVADRLGLTSGIVRDMTGDGRPDVVTRDELNQSLSVFTNSGDGPYPLGAPLLLPLDATPRGIALADIDGDGWPDIFTMTGTPAAMSFTRNGGSSTTFVPDTTGTLAIANDPLRIQTGDLNADGGEDLLVLTTGAVPAPGLVFAVLLNTNPPPPPCPGDYNSDGGIDGADVASFFDDWEAGLMQADVNGDGGIDGSDVDVFFDHWEGGC